MENIKKILEIDWVDFICKKYKEIPENDRKAFWIIFTTLNLMFIFHTINFLWGTDDWAGIKIEPFINNDFYEGRFGDFLLKTFFFQGQILPVINNVFAFLGFSLGVIVLFKYWELDNKIEHFTVAGIIFVCNPLTNAWLFYQKDTIEHLWIFLFIPFGLYLATKYKIADGIKFYASNIVSILLILLSISIYQPCINALFVILFGKLFIKSIEGKFSELAVTFTKSVVNVGIASLLYILMYKICIAKGIINLSYYNQKTISDIPTFLNQINLAFNAIFVENFCFEKILMPGFITKMFLIITIIALITCLIKIFTEKTSVFKRITVSSFIFVLILLSTQIAQIIAEYNIFGNARMIFYGTLVFNIFMLVLVLKYTNIKVKNFVYLICLILFFEYITVNFVSQKAFKFATTAEVSRMNSIANKIMEQPNFVKDKEYKMLVIGGFDEIRRNYVGNFDGANSWELGYSSIMPEWGPNYGITFYHSEINIPSGCFTYSENITKEKKAQFFINLIDNRSVLTKFKSHINELKSWPSKDFVVIDDDLIILVFDENSLKEVKSGLTEWEM